MCFLDDLRTHACSASRFLAGELFAPARLERNNHPQDPPSRSLFPTVHHQKARCPPPPPRSPRRGSSSLTVSSRPRSTSEFLFLALSPSLASQGSRDCKEGIELTPSPSLPTSGSSLVSSPRRDTPAARSALPTLAPRSVFRRRKRTTEGRREERLS